MREKQLLINSTVITAIALVLIGTTSVVVLVPFQNAHALGNWVHYDDVPSQQFTIAKR